MTTTITIANLITRVDELLELGKQVLATKHSTGGHFNVVYVKSGPMAGFRSASLSFIDRVYGSAHPHFNEFTKGTEKSRAGDAERGVAILEAIRSEIAGGWLFTIKGLIIAELFSDFLEMADHLQESGYKDPAAVMIGSVLEEHLRQLCVKHTIETAEEKDGKLVQRKQTGSMPIWRRPVSIQNSTRNRLLLGSIYETTLPTGNTVNTLAIKCPSSSQASRDSWQGLHRNRRETKEKIGVRVRFTSTST
ncbi:MAG: hypothetical protein Q7U80_14270 [Thiobacillus sp.]|nr:hypothetical protein [Thiobacillus sp.]